MKRLITPSPSKAKVILLGGFLLGSMALVAKVGFQLLVEPGANVRWPVLNQILGALGLGLASWLSAFTIWSLYRAVNTFISIDGICQPSLRGQLLINWTEVESVTTERDTIHLISSKGRAIVASGLYAEPDQIKEIVLTTCKAAIQAD